MEVERAMSSELQALKQELRQKGSQNRQQDEELISAMREQVTILPPPIHTCKHTVILWIILSSDDTYSASNRPLKCMHTLMLTYFSTICNALTIKPE